MNARWTDIIWGKMSLVCFFHEYKSEEKERMIALACDRTWSNTMNERASERAIGQAREQLDWVCRKHWSWHIEGWQRQQNKGVPLNFVPPCDRSVKAPWMTFGESMKDRNTSFFCTLMLSKIDSCEMNCRKQWYNPSETHFWLMSSFETESLKGSIA